MEQYDEDYMYGEYNDNNIGTSKDCYKHFVVRRERKHTIFPTKYRIRNYIQYYLLYRYLTNPLQWSDHNSKENRNNYIEFISKLKIDIQKHFHLDKYSKLSDITYLKSNLKNKKYFIVYSIKKVLTEYPEIYEDNYKILEHMSKIPPGRMFYDAKYYNKCLDLYKKIYGIDSIYPVKKAMYDIYFPFINFIKRSVL